MYSMLRQKVHLRYLLFAKRYISRLPSTATCKNSLSCCIQKIKNDPSYCTQRYLATVAHNYEVNQEPLSEEKLDLTVESIDEALSKIDAYAKRVRRVLKKDVQFVYDCINNLGTASSIQALYLLRSCGSLMHDEVPCNRTKLVNQIWNKFKELGIPLDASHYNALLKAYLENNHEFSPTDFLSTMEQNGVTPNRVTYQRLIERFCVLGDLTGASAILAYMKEKGLAVNEAVFNSLIKGHIKCGDFAGAKNMLDVMRKSELVPSSATYTTLACGFAANGDLDGVRSTFELADKNGIFLFNDDYLAVIYKFAASGNIDYIDEILSYMGELKHTRQQCVNLMLDLMNNGLEIEAYKFLKKITTNVDFQNGVVLFTKQLLNLQKPVEKLIYYCEDFRSCGYDDFIFVSVAKMALEMENIADAMVLFKEHQKHGLPLRSHFFWPIFTIHARNGNEKGIFETLKKMSDFGLVADFDTYYDYVLPVISTENLENVIQNIEHTGQSVAMAVEALFQYFCTNNMFENAVDLCKNYTFECNLKFLERTILSKIDSASVDEAMLLKVLQYACENNSRQGDDYILFNDFCCNIFLKLSIGKKLSEDLLKEAHGLGVVVSRQYANSICENIGRSNPEVIQIVRSMQYEAPLPASYKVDTSIHPKDMSIDILEKHLDDLKASGSSTRTALRHLLTQYCKKKDLEKLLAVKDDLDSQGFMYTPAAFALMIDTFVSFNDFENAQKLMTQLKEEYPNVKLDNVKAINFAGLFIKCNKFQEAKDILNEECNELNFNQKDTLLRAIKKFLNTVSDTGDVQLTNDMFQFFISKLDLLSPKYLLEPLVKVHLNRDDVDNAIKEYNRCLQIYNFAPCRNQLFKKCIMISDFEKLQSVVDVTASYNGKVSTLHELAFSFLECGHIQQAHKVFQTLGGRVEMAYLEELSGRFSKDNKVTELEQLITVTSGLNHVNQDKLYYDLLVLHAQNNDYVKALELWDSIQEKNIQPSINTLRLLAQILENNEQPIPFVVPSGNQSMREDTSIEKELEDSGGSSHLLKSLSSRDVTEIIHVLKGMKKGQVRSLSLETMTHIMDVLAAKNCLKDVSSIVHVMSYTLEKARVIFKPLLEKYAANGNLDLIKQIMEFLPDFTLKSITFNYFFNKAYLVCGLHEELLSELEGNIGSNVKLFSFSGFMELLKTAPHLEDKAIELVDAYAKRESFDIPRRALWIHYFIHEKYDKAEEIFKQYSSLFTSMDLIATHVLKVVKSEQNDVLGQKLIDFLNKYEIKDVVKDRTYSCVLDVLVTRVKLEEAVALIEEAQQMQIPVSRFNRSTLLSLKEALQEKNKPVPFEIPLQDDGSSSSSDSE